MSVDTAGISGKGGAHYPGRSTGLRYANRYQEITEGVGRSQQRA